MIYRRQRRLNKLSDDKKKINGIIEKKKTAMKKRNKQTKKNTHLETNKTFIMISVVIA